MHILNKHMCAYYNIILKYMHMCIYYEVCMKYTYFICIYKYTCMYIFICVYYLEWAYLPKIKIFIYIYIPVLLKYILNGASIIIYTF